MGCWINLQEKSEIVGEFDFIEKYFAPLAPKGSPAFGLKNDAAVLTSPSKNLVFTKDALVEGVHFLPDTSGECVAQKAARVNLSDLAAMGADPLGYLVALVLPEKYATEDWVASFAAGLSHTQKEFGWVLWGGDTVSTPGPLTISLTAIGSVEGYGHGRDGAGADDLIYVSGTLGDSAIGLAILKGELQVEEGADYFTERYHMPKPRIALGKALSGFATSVMDISDGLLGDMAHICASSGHGAQLFVADLPTSPCFGKLLERSNGYKSRVWDGGDDYELLFTVPKNCKDRVEALSRDLKLPLTNIGHMTAEGGVQLLDEKLLAVEGDGFHHF